MRPSATTTCFPATTDLLLGGTHERDVWTLDPNPEAKHRVLAEH